jgi:hypothetical protein
MCSFTMASIECTGGGTVLADFIPTGQLLCQYHLARPFFSQCLCKIPLHTILYALTNSCYDASRPIPGHQASTCLLCSNIYLDIRYHFVSLPMVLSLLDCSGGKAWC